MDGCKGVGKTHGQHQQRQPEGQNILHQKQGGCPLFIPQGFAHGFAVLSESAVFQYKCDNFYHPEADGGISILDESLGIDWGLAMEEALLSEKDTKHPKLAEFDSPFVWNQEQGTKNQD